MAKTVYFLARCLVMTTLCLFLFVAVGNAQDRSDVEVEGDRASLTEAEFKKLHAELQPKNETWKTIPWHADLLSAQRRAAKEGKLIFIWAMDGHPLGCT